MEKCHHIFNTTGWHKLPSNNEEYRHHYCIHCGETIYEKRNEKEEKGDKENGTEHTS